MDEFLKSDAFAFAVLPALIFLARVVDVSLGTLRVILVSKGIRALAPVVGFFEVIVWLAAIGQIMNRLDNIWCFAAYALGFSTGTYLPGHVHRGPAPDREGRHPGDHRPGG